MAEVFVSYSKSDRNYADKLHGGLSNQVDLWMFTKHLPGGERWSPAIDNALQRADAVIVVVTPAIIESQWIVYEWSYALGKGKHVIPLMFEPVDAKEIHDKLKELQIIPFIDPSEQDWHDLRKRLAECTLRGRIMNSQRLLTVLQTSPDYRARKEALRQLAKLDDETYRSTFIADIAKTLADDPEYSVRSEAAEVLGQWRAIGAEAVLIEALKDAMSTVRGEAARALGKLRSRRAVEPLLISLYDEEYVCGIAARSLGQIGDKKAVEGLKAILNHKSAHVRAFSAEALGAMGSDAASAVPKLIELLNDYTLVHSDKRVCDEAAEALRRIRNMEGLEAVRRWEHEES